MNGDYFNANFIGDLLLYFVYKRFLKNRVKFNIYLLQGLGHSSWPFEEPDDEPEEEPPDNPVTPCIDPCDNPADDPADALEITCIKPFKTPLINPEESEPPLSTHYYKYNPII